MARSLACQSPCQNLPPTGKDEFAGAALTKGSGTSTPTSAVSHTPTLALALLLALAIAPAPDAANSAAKYSAEDLQQIFKTVLEAKAPTPAFQPDGPWEKLFKAQVPDLYYRKTHMECYNFCQKCKDYFVTTGATGLNCVSFAAMCLKDQTLFY